MAFKHHHPIETSPPALPTPCTTTTDFIIHITDIVRHHRLHRPRRRHYTPRPASPTQCTTTDFIFFAADPSDMDRVLYPVEYNILASLQQKFDYLSTRDRGTEWNNRLSAYVEENVSREPDTFNLHPTCYHDADAFPPFIYAINHTSNNDSKHNGESHLYTFIILFQLFPYNSHTKNRDIRQRDREKMYDHVSTATIRQ